ncbi:MAG: AtpZ/AtpI family protein [Candidatus Cloacimonetes bacterium]|nr:AtpZ/AtpI family protein [Candidatus Cloacimonadota bacterium]
MWKKQKILDKELLRHLSLLGQLGFTVVSSILIFFFVFLYLDRKLQTGGILVGVGVFLGVIAGVLAAYKLLKRFYDK